MTPTLRDYQTRDRDRLRREYATGAKAVLYQAPTGSGKTVLFSHIADGAAARGKRIAVVVHRQELLDQCSRALHALELDHGIVAAGRHPSLTHRVMVCSAQTLVRRLGRMPAFDLLVLDEAHHATAGTWRKIIDAQPQARLLGVTATPLRLDGRGLGSACGGVFDRLVVGPTCAGLIEQGYLSPFTVYAPPSTLDLSGVRKQAGDYARGQLAERVDRPKIIGDAVAHYERLCKGAPAIAFCATVAHAEHTAEQFRAHGFRAESIDGTLSPAIRRQRIEALGHGHLNVLTSCEIVSEGTDIPVVAVAILLRPTQSLGLYLQQVGRALRPAPGKERALILDHVGNVARHGFPDDERDWSLDGLRQAKAKEPVESVRTCESCYAAFRPVLAACPICGASYQPKAREIEQAEGDLQEITAAQREAMQRQRRVEVGRAQTLDDLLAVAERRGYNSGWAYHIWRARQRKGAA